MNKKNLIVYVAGPINADHVYECWQSNQEDQSSFAKRYLLEFYSACQDLSLEFHVIAPVRTAEHPRKSKYTHIDYWRFTAYKVYDDKKYRGISYHIHGCIFIFKVILRAVTLGASVIVITQATPYWFLMNLAGLFRIQVIPSLHCVLWPKFNPSRKRIYRILFSLTANFFKFGCATIMVVSDDIAAQVKRLTHNSSRPIIRFFPLYHKDIFANVIQSEKVEFIVLFVGRVETDKGVFDLLEIARQLHEENNVNIVFELCGTGSVLEDLKSKVQQLGLEKTFRFHGFCDKPQLKAYYVNSDVVIIPTKTSFIEGFNKVCIEAILASKPVITSEVCPAASEIRPAALIVPPDDIEAYKTAILALYSDKDLYEQKKVSAGKLKERFFEPKNSWGEKFKTVILNHTNLMSDHISSVR